MPAPKNLSTALAIANTVLTMRDEEFEESEQNVRAVIEEVGKLMQGLVDNACDLEPETRQRLEMMAFVARNNRSDHDGSAATRAVQSWNKTPERKLLKCVLGHLIRSVGFSSKELLLAAFKRLIPDYQAFFDPPGVSDSAIYGRADTGRRGGKYAKENPATNPFTAPYWEAARKIVEAGVPLTAEDVSEIATLSPPPAPAASPDPDPPDHETQENAR